GLLLARGDRAPARRTRGRSRLRAPALAVRAEAGSAPHPRPRRARAGRTGAIPAVIGALIEEEADVVAIARGLSTVAVLGIKDADEPDAPAHTIPALLARTGVRVIGINPRVKHALGSATLVS